MTVEELKETVEENRRTLEEDAEDTGQSYIIMTDKGGTGLVMSAGNLEDLANMAANMLMMIFKKRGGKLAVLEGINGLMDALLKDALVKMEETDHEEVDLRTIN